MSFKISIDKETGIANIRGDLKYCLQFTIGLLKLGDKGSGAFEHEISSLINEARAALRAELTSACEQAIALVDEKYSIEFKERTDKEIEDFKAIKLRDEAERLVDLPPIKK